MKYLIVLIICAFSASSFGKKLDRSEINESISNIKSIPLKHNGKDGIWFPKEDAELLLNLVTNKFKLSLDIIDSQNLQIAAQKSAIDGYKLSNESYMDLSSLNKEMFDVAMKHLPDLNPPKPSWYESPKATFVYGLMVGGVVVMGTTYLATQALDSR